MRSWSTVSQSLGPSWVPTAARNSSMDANPMAASCVLSGTVLSDTALSDTVLSDSLCQADATVDDKRLSGDPGGIVRCEERHGTGHILGQPEPSQRVFRRCLVLAALVQHPGELRFD